MLGKLKTGELNLSAETEKLRDLAKSHRKDSKLLLHAADQLDNLVISNYALKEMLKRLEWASVREGPGSGYMSSGGDGARIPACPICRIVHPEKGKSDFIAEALGHKPDCELLAVLRAEGND